MTRWVLVMSLCAGCSFAWHDSHIRSPPLSIAECPSRIRAVVDTVGTAGFAFVMAEAYAHKDEADSAAMIWVMPLAMSTLAFASSAIYGYIKPGQCERSFATN